MKIISILLLLILPILLWSNSPKILEVDKQIVYQVFDGNYHAADSLLEAQIMLYPDLPKYFTLKAHALFYTRYFDNTGMDRDSLMQLIMDYTQKAIDVSDELAKTIDIKFYLGVAHGYRSRINGIRQEFYDAYWDARKCYNYLEDVIEEDPAYYDAYLGMAVIDYFNATRITGWRRTLAWFLGMTGDREKALEFFNKVEEKGSLFQAEATFINAMMHRFLEIDFDRATPYLENLMAQYPNNTFMQNQYRSLQFNQLIQEKGVDYLAANIDSLRSQYNINNANILNAIGYNYVNNQDYQTALAVFQLNVRLFPEIANCYDSVAEGYMLLGRNDEAIRNYRIAFEKLDSDTTITEDFRELLRESIPERLRQLEAL
jgi:Tfp pilus assembly protein PilF